LQSHGGGRDRRSGGGDCRNNVVVVGGGGGHISSRNTTYCTTTTISMNVCPTTKLCWCQVTGHRSQVVVVAVRRALCVVCVRNQWSLLVSSHKNDTASAHRAQNLFMFPISPETSLLAAEVRGSHKILPSVSGRRLLQKIVSHVCRQGRSGIP
jgi:hypothetical protein